MALQKQPMSLDLIKGSDTKTNDQISNNFKEMENVVFSGNLTAKKMNGFDVIGSLPVGESFSLLAKRRDDLLAFSENGTYKYISPSQTFIKISDSTVSKIKSTNSNGKYISTGANYYCIHDEYFGPNGQTGAIYFYYKDGTLINKIEGNLTATYSASSAFKILNNGDDFYACYYDASAAAIYILKYSINPTTKQFYYSAYVGGASASGAIQCIDFIMDSTNIYCAYGTATTFYRALWPKTGTTGSAPAVTNTTPITCTSIELFIRDASNLYISAMYYVSPSVYNHDLLVSTIASLGITSQVPLNVFSTQQRVMCYPTSDTTAVTTTSKNPVSKIFKQGNFYYIAKWFYNRGQIFTAIGKLSLLSGNYYRAKYVAICDSSNVVFNSAPFSTMYSNYMAISEVGSINGEAYIASINPNTKNSLIKFNSVAGQDCNYVEIDKTTFLSNGLPLYYDGNSITEVGFLDAPQITGYTTDLTGSLPADTYYFMCLYEWRDANGNVFYSQWSNQFKLILAANSKVFLEIKSNLNTEKTNVILKIFIRGTNKLYQLIASYNYNTTSPILLDGYSEQLNIFTLATYPATDKEIAPYQDGSIQPEIITNTKSMSLYSDRIMQISDDNESSISYTHQKVPQEGFEFNSDTLYLDVLDKVGINEYDLVGTFAMDGRLIIFKKNSILYINGSGPSRTNTNDDFSQPQIISTDVGCISERSIVLTPNGLMFKSYKGIYILTRRLEVDYIGASVEAFNSNTITSAILMEDYNEVRFSTLEGQVLVYNYFSSAWSWFTGRPSKSACIWKNSYILLGTDNKLYQESKTHKKIIDGATHTAITQKISTPWIRGTEKQWWEKVYDVLILGKYKSPHQVKLSVYYDYELYASDVYVLDVLAQNQYNIVSKPSDADIEANISSNGVYQLTIDMIRKSCQAFRIVIEDIPQSISTNTGESFEISNITATIGIKKGPAKLPANKSY